MAAVILSKAARNDLLHIFKYIRDDLSNPSAAQRILHELRTSIEKLAEIPERGKPLDAVIAFHTEYRYLICENYRVFYLFDGETVEVVRILHTLQNFMKALF